MRIPIEILIKRRGFINYGSTLNPKPQVGESLNSEPDTLRGNIQPQVPSWPPVHLGGAGWLPSHGVWGLGFLESRVESLELRVLGFGLRV